MPHVLRTLQLARRMGMAEGAAAAVVAVNFCPAPGCLGPGAHQPRALQRAEAYAHPCRSPQPCAEHARTALHRQGQGALPSLTGGPVFFASVPALWRSPACVPLPPAPLAGAGIVGMSATYPMDMVRGRITIQEAGNAQYRGLLHATGCIVR